MHLQQVEQFLGDNLLNISGSKHLWKPPKFVPVGIGSRWVGGPEYMKCAVVRWW
jgi:hypothetical protein